MTKAFWYTDWRWLGTILLLVLMLGFIIFQPWDNKKEEVVEAVSTPEKQQTDTTPVFSSHAIVLLPARKDCDVSDSTQTFCSSDPQIVSISDKGELHLKDTGTVHICTRKPIASITYKVVTNYVLTFTSSLDIENPRCDKFVVTKAGQ